jgi:hypothetical protein
MALKENAKLINVINSYHKLYDECAEKKPDIVEMIEYELFIMSSEIKSKSTLKLFKLYYQKEIDINTLIEEFSIIVSSLNEPVFNLFLNKYSDMYIKYFNTIETEIKHVQIIDEQRRFIEHLNREMNILKAKNISVELNNKKYIQDIENLKEEQKEDKEFYEKRMNQIISENSKDFIKNQMNNSYILCLSILVFIFIAYIFFNFKDQKYNNDFCLAN